MRKKFFVPFILACVTLSSCSGNLVAVSGKAPADSFTLELEPTSSIAVGESKTLVLGVNPVEGAELGDVKVTWVNTDNSILSVSDSDSTELIITGLESGTSTVTAIVDGSLQAASCRITVNGSGSIDPSIVVSDITLSDSTKTFDYVEGGNNSFPLIATVHCTPQTASVTVNWYSTVKSVATVTSRGNQAVVNVLGPGETNIVASYGSIFASCKLSVNNASDPATVSVSLNKTTLSLEEGDTETLVATTKGNVQMTRWQSDHPEFASVDQAGKVTAVSAGTATISVTVSDGDQIKTATCIVNVKPTGQASEYEAQLATWSKKGHIYFHYLREHADYDNWALWIWQSFPRSLEGSLWGANASHFSETTPIKPENIQTFGYMKKSECGGEGSDIYSDEYGRIIDVDLLADPIKGGKTGNDSPLVSNWEKLMKTDIGFLVVDQTKMTGETMWTSDGSGETFIKKLGTYLTEGKESYLHVYCVEGNVSNYTTSSGKQVVNNPTLEPNTNGKYRSNDDTTLLTRDDYGAGVATSTSFKEDRPGVGYQIFVPSYADSDGDGFGDLRGIINKLDYIKNDVGAEVLWLTPIQESNSYHGYDVTDYYKIDSRFGTIEDYQELIYKAHKLGMKVLMDMVINHTSKSNVLFKKSEAAVEEVINGKTISYRDMYIWKYKDDDVMVWDQTGKSTTVGLDNFVSKKVTDKDCSAQWFQDGTSDYYYFGKFGSGMAELNYNCQATRDYMTDMCKYWLSFGLDGFRLDAIKHIYLLGELNPNLKTLISGHDVTYDVGFKTYWNEEMGKEDTVPNDYSYDRDMNVLFWKQFAGSIKASYPNCFLVGENFDGWNERMAPFYKSMDSQFDFSTYYHLNELKEESIAYDVGTSLNEYAKYRSDLINGAYTSNHDVARMLNHAAAHDDSVNSKYSGGDGIHHKEITLENTMGGPGRNVEYAKDMARYYAAMTILTPGVSWIYYGDEIGMSGNIADKMPDSQGRVFDDHGNNIDRWYRQPMKWDNEKGGPNGTVDYIFGGIEVLWDKYNENELQTVGEQKLAAGSMLNYFKALCAVKNNDRYPTYGFISGAGTFSGDQTVKFDISDGARNVTVFINNSSSAKGFSMQGYSLLGCSEGGSANSCPAHGFVVMVKN